MADDLTVIVVALLGGGALDQCVQMSRAQCSNVLAVRRDGTIIDPEHRTLGMSERLDIPAKRRSGVELATTPFVALLEDTVVPERGWANAVMDAFMGQGVVACGGPIALDSKLPAQTRALTLSEYGRYSDRRQAGEVSALPGCNFAFRRDALIEAMRESEGLVDLPVFSRLKELGGKLVWTPAMAVTFSHPYPEGAQLKTRFGHGRIYASANARLQGRVVTAAKSFLLPAVLTARTIREVGPALLRSSPTLGWLILQHTAWAAGELAGALFGPSRKGLGQWR